MMPFKKGQSGNPGGKPPKNRELEALILEKTNGHAYFVDKLMAFIDSARDHATRLQALFKLMEYAYGKPRQQLEIEGGEQPTKVVIVTGVPAPTDGKTD